MSDQSIGYRQKNCKVKPVQTPTYQQPRAFVQDKATLDNVDNTY